MIVFMLLALCNLYLASDIVFLYCIAGDEMTRVIWKYIKDKVINHFLALIVIIAISFFFLVKNAFNNDDFFFVHSLFE
jgi:hypothetical protein